MSQHSSTVTWNRGEQPFLDNRYSRAHHWSFDGGAVVDASSSPHSVRVPFSDPFGVDPEEAFVASVSSCHMLWFLSLAVQRGLTVDSYTDAAVGTLAAFADGRVGMTEVVLRPQLVFSGATQPDDAAVAALHHAAHQACYIANSVRTQIRIEGGWRSAA